MIKPRVIILLAGMGSRLGRPHPKSLSPLGNGESILSRQLRIFKEQGMEVTAVVGFKKDLIMEEAYDALFAYNANYDTTNTSKSLLCALRHYPNEDVLWVNGDVVFDAKIIDLVISSETSAVAVNNASVAEEEIKYTLNEHGYINAISKQVKNALGEALGINLIKATDVADFIAELEEVADDEYFERGMETLIEKRGNVFKPVDIGEHSCVEVDFDEDLKQAKHLIQNMR